MRWGLPPIDSAASPATAVAQLAVQVPRRPTQSSGRGRSRFSYWRHRRGRNSEGGKKKEGCLLWGNVIGLLEEEEMSLLLEVLAKR